MGSSQSRLNHLVRPTRTRGAMPFTWGTEPAQVPVPGVDDVLARGQLPPVAAHDVGGDAQRRRSGQVFRGGVGVGAHGSYERA